MHTKFVDSFHGPLYFDANGTFSEAHIPAGNVINQFFFFFAEVINTAFFNLDTSS